MDLVTSAAVRRSASAVLVHKENAEVAPPPVSLPALPTRRALSERIRHAVLLLPSDPCAGGIAEQLLPLGGVAPLAVCARLQHCLAEPAHKAGREKGEQRASRASKGRAGRAKGEQGEEQGEERTCQGA